MEESTAVKKTTEEELETNHWKQIATFQHLLIFEKDDKLLVFNKTTKIIEATSQRDG